MSKDATEIKSALGKKYEIKGLISSGGMGDIFLGIHRALDKRVAIKIVHQELSKDEEFRKRFRREAKLAASLDHPVVIDIYDFGSKDDFDYIIMPYIEGSTLQDRLKKEGKFTVQECLRLMIALTDALSYAHKNNVVHRDIKPSNIMVDNHGHLILTDFGISKSLGDVDVTKPNTMLGSPKYMSPEQVRGLAVDGRTDLYSLGLVFYEMVTGKHPFEGKDGTAILYCQACEMPQRPEESLPDVPGPVGDIIMKLLEKSPDQRYQSADELLKDLEWHSSCLSKDLRLDVDATMVAAKTPPNGKEGGAVMALQKTVIQQQRPQAVADGLTQPLQLPSKGKKLKSWMLPALGVALVLVAGIVWVIRSSPTTKGVTKVKDYAAPGSLIHKDKTEPPSTGKAGVSEPDIEEKLAPEPHEVQSPEALFDSLVTSLLAFASEREATFFRVWVDKPEFRIGESITYHFGSDKACYLVLLNVTTAGELIQVFPNKFTLDQSVEARRDYTIPGDQMDLELKITGPPGKEEIVALVAEAPFDLLSATFGSQPFFQVDRHDRALLEKITSNFEKIGRLNIAQKRLSYSIIDGAGAP